MYDIEFLIKNFDNVFPVKGIKVKYKTKDGTFKETIEYVPDYTELERIRATMTLSEIERQRSIL